MKRSRLRNIVNKSKELNTIKDPFDSFKNSLPIGLDYYKDGGKYRLKAAWEAYGKPKDFKEARWNGLIETFDGNSFIMPSIGYNAEKDSYEYLNIGKENEIVNKDLRAWDNDVIPFIKELKYGGYIKKFNEEEGYWSYVKEISNPEEEIGSFKKGGKVKVQMADGSGTIEIDEPDADLKAGRKPIGLNKSGKKLYLNGDGKAVYAENTKENPEQTKWMLKGDKLYSHWKKPEDWNEEKIPFLEWVKELHPNEYNGNYDLETAYKVYPKEDLERWKWARTRPTLEEREYYGNYLDENGRYIYHLGSIAEIPGTEDFIFLKKGRGENNPELHYETDSYWNGENGLRDTHDLKYEGDRYFYRKREKDKKLRYKQGGQMNVIPEGALHARKNGMELAKEGEITHKGVPVVDNDGNQQAEIERNEIIFNKNTTDTIEKAYKEFYQEDTTKARLDELAIKIGKFLSKLILENTEDRTGLIEEVKEKM